ncbi:hypothetical protein HK103_000208 [Boothiomyces macroporosus]|uniref:GATA-type domain-containing protein n=1 Tax=Boothiomyces macroporosus TaxID=261099 RepID=A0AAD5UKH8_9FUNG|nr:hypothetical protein HK103_000208 [Boothiomyces macroporosus]
MNIYTLENTSAAIAIELLEQTKNYYYMQTIKTEQTFTNDWINDSYMWSLDSSDNLMESFINDSFLKEDPPSPISSAETLVQSEIQTQLEPQFVPFSFNGPKQYDVYPKYQPFIPPTQTLPTSPVSITSEKEERKLTASEKKKMREYARNLTCFNCKTNKTPLWRRTEDKQHNLCNACGLYYKQYKSHRPVAYKDRHPRAPKRQPPTEKSALLEQMLVQVANSSAVSGGSVTLDWSQLEALINAARN